MFLLKLLGIWSSIKEFFLNNWKWIVPLILLVISFFIVSNHYYNKGISTEKTSWEKRIKEEDTRNRKFEIKLNDAINNFGNKAAKEAADRVIKETIYKNKIETIIKDNPIYTQCLVDQEILDSRNAIREQGPK